MYSCQKTTMMRPWNSGRVGSAVATAALLAGHQVSVLDEDPLSHEILDGAVPDSWEDQGGMFTIGTALDLPAGTIASRISRCLAGLRKVLEGKKPAPSAV